MNANTNSFGKTLAVLHEKNTFFRWSTIDVDRSVYSCQLSVIQAREELQEEVMLGCCY